MHSHHSHSGQFCRHAAPGTTLEDSVRAAIARGLRTFGLSEHVPRYRVQDLYPEEEDLTPADLGHTFTAYLAEAHRLKTAYAGQIDLLVGLETDYITPLDLTHLERLLSDPDTREQVEYVVGSVHHVREQGIDFSKSWWDACLAGFEPSPLAPPGSQQPSDEAITAYLHSYMDAQHTLLARIQPPVIGHFDLCRLYTPSLPLNNAERFPGVWEKVERNVREVVAYGGMFEVSAASFRKGWDEAYPGKEVLQCIIVHRGRLCLSDDSHGPEAVTQNYLKLRDYLLEQGVTELWYLASVTPGHTDDAGMTNPRRLGWSWLDPGRRMVVPRRYEGDWARDPFWAALEEREAARSV